MSITNAAEPSTNAVFPLSISGLSSVDYGRGDTLLRDAARAAFAAGSRLRIVFRLCSSRWRRTSHSIGAGFGSGDSA